MKKLMLALEAVAALSAFAEEPKLEVMAVYYPHWHKYPKGTEWFGEKWDEGEWAFVRTAVPGSVPSSGSLDISTINRFGSMLSRVAISR